MKIFKLVFSKIMPNFCRYLGIHKENNCTFMFAILIEIGIEFEYVHYHLQVHPNPKKKLYKKTDAIFSIYGKYRINPWHFFFNSHLGLSRSLRSNENWRWIFEAGTSKFCNHSWKFGSSPRNGKVDLCMTNGSRVLIYLTFQFSYFTVLLLVLQVK